MDSTVYRVYYTAPAGHRVYREYVDAAKADRMAEALDGKVVPSAVKEPSEAVQAARDAAETARVELSEGVIAQALRQTR